jgi:hypothetical protein
VVDTGVTAGKRVLMGRQVAWRGASANVRAGRKKFAIRRS